MHTVFLESTVIQSMPGLPKQHRRVIQYQKDSSDQTLIEIRRDSIVPVAEVPPSVDPTSASIEQVESFVKSGFVLHLCRRWTSSDAVQLDTLMNEKAPD